MQRLLRTDGRTDRGRQVSGAAATKYLVESLWVALSSRPYLLPAILIDLRSAARDGLCGVAASAGAVYGLKKAK